MLHVCGNWHKKIRVLENPVVHYSLTYLLNAAVEFFFILLTPPTVQDAPHDCPRSDWSQWTRPLAVADRYTESSKLGGWWHAFQTDVCVCLY
jgi:hypothetical protein